ncbi:MAG: Flp pilus assembly complex ATPase component TadA [Planctomycetaceae bacterium]|nr:Flp pilus assembly complex ATPase component TadA [Planctomycetaceae bacterium]
MSQFFRSHFLVFPLVLFVLTLFSLTEQKSFAQLAEQMGVMAVQGEVQGGGGGGGGGGEAPAPPPPPNKGEAKKAALENISTALYKDGGWWGPGWYFDPIKLSLYIVLFILWVGMASWMNADQERLRRENRETFNLVYLLLCGVVGTGIFFIPLFWVAFSLIVLLYFVPVLTYVVIRNQSLPPGEKVLTGEHLWFLYAVYMGKIFRTKIKHGQRLSYESGPAVELEPLGKGVDPQTLQARLILARNDPGYNLFRENINEAVESRATAMMFDFTPEQTKIRHQVDGTWLDLVPIPRRLGRSREKDIYEEMLEAVKKLVGANHEDRRSKQGGTFKAIIGNPKKKNKLKKFEIEFKSQGTPTGEAAMFQLQAQIVPFKTLTEIGVRDEMQPKILEQINGKKGIVIISAPPAHGLRSTMTILAKSADRFTRDVATVEDVNGASESIENVIPGLYDSSKGETPMKTLPDLLFRGIGVIFVRDLSGADTVKVCCEAMEHDDRLFITMTRAKDGVETLKRFLSVGYPAQKIVPHLSSTVCQRLIRKLCPDCKEAYTPDPKVLQQLRLNPNQVQELVRKRTPLPTPHEEAKRGICVTCHGVGYYGRTALFELLTVSEATKALLLANADPAAIRQQFNKEGQQTFLHEGIRLILKGETDIDELSRVLKM